MNVWRFHPFCVLVLFASGSVMGCKGGAQGQAQDGAQVREQSVEVGPICPACVAGGESSDFNGGVPDYGGDICEVAFRTAKPFNADEDSDEGRLLRDVRRRLGEASNARFQWSVPTNVDPGSSATGYEPGVIGIETEFEFGATWVEDLDPTACADGYCFYRNELVRCALREERWLRQDFDVRLTTSDHAIDATLSGSARITMEGRFFTGEYVGQPVEVSSSEVEGTLRLTTSEAHYPRMVADLNLVGSQLRGHVSIRTWAWDLLVGDWPIANDGNTDDCGWSTVPAALNAPHAWIGGKTPLELTSAVRVAMAQAQHASWDEKYGNPAPSGSARLLVPPAPSNAVSDECPPEQGQSSAQSCAGDSSGAGSDTVLVALHEDMGTHVCLGRDTLEVPKQGITVTTSESGLQAEWSGLTISHDDGDIIGFSSSANFAYDADEGLIGERSEDSSSPGEVRMFVGVSDAKMNVSSGYGTWKATAFPAWDLMLVKLIQDTPKSCLGTDSRGYNACSPRPEQLPTVSIDVADIATRIIEARPPSPAASSVPGNSESPSPADAGVSGDVSH
jgi:hypothetical protein